MFFRKPNYRRFDYTPQFYDPDQDEELKDLERRKRKLGFRNARSRNKVKSKSTMYYLMLFVIIVLTYLALTDVI